MHERCLVCDLKFDREPGYFLGAMYVSYGLGIVIVAHQPSRKVIRSVHMRQKYTVEIDAFR